MFVGGADRKGAKGLLGEGRQRLLALVHCSVWAVQKTPGRPLLSWGPKHPATFRGKSPFSRPLQDLFFFLRLQNEIAPRNNQKKARQEAKRIQKRPEPSPNNFGPSLAASKYLAGTSLNV